MGQEHQRLIRKLETIARLTDADRQAFNGLPLRIRAFEADTDLVRDGDKPSECCLLVEGLACRYKLLGHGGRQIMSFHVPGEIPDLQSLHLRVMDHSLGTLTRGVAAYIPHEAVGRITERSASVTAVLWRESLIDAAIFREWLAGIGRRTAHQRVAHLICEFFLRMRPLGLTRDGTMDLPITQAEFGDALGLSTVHVNRVLQDLRAEELITYKGGQLRIDDLARIQRLADFDPTYLHLLPDALEPDAFRPEGLASR